MNYAIQFEALLSANLVVTPRKKVIKHSLIRVMSGLVLCKLGKHEYSVEAKQSFWIPFDCLCSLTIFPNTQWQRVDFSVRLTADFSHQAGYVTLSELSQAACDHLSQCQPNDEIYSHLLHVLKSEATHFKPKLSLNNFSEKLSAWQPHQVSELPIECQIALRVREAQKRKLSGIKLSQIVDELFQGNEQECQQLALLVLGRNL